MEDKARLVIAEHLGVPPSLVCDQASFRDLGADSLDLISLTMALEEALDIHIPGDVAESCTTVGDALRMLRQRAAAPETHLAHA
jgi:acyl carrier protein